MNLFKRKDEVDPLDLPTIKDEPARHTRTEEDIWEQRRWETAVKHQLQYVRSCVLGKFKAKPSYIARLSRIHADELVREMRRDTHKNDEYDDA